MHLARLMETLLKQKKLRETKRKRKRRKRKKQKQLVQNQHKKVVVKANDDNDIDDFEENEMINIRKFPSVKLFMKRISGLDSVLQSVEVYSSEIRSMRLSGGSGEYG